MSSVVSVGSHREHGAHGGKNLCELSGLRGIVYTFIRLRRRHDLSPLARSAWVVFLVLATVMNMFNDLFREPIYWATLGLAVGSSVASPRTEQHPTEGIARRTRRTRRNNRE